MGRFVRGEVVVIPFPFLRAEIVASGEPLLSWDELDAEIAERRGGVHRHSDADE